MVLGLRPNSKVAGQAEEVVVRRTDQGRLCPCACLHSFQLLWQVLVHLVDGLDVEDHVVAEISSSDSVLHHNPAVTSRSKCSMGALHLAYCQQCKFAGTVSAGGEAPDSLLPMIVRRCRKTMPADSSSSDMNCKSNQSYL